MQVQNCFMCNDTRRLMQHLKAILDLLCLIAYAQGVKDPDIEEIMEDAFPCAQDEPEAPTEP